MSPMYHAPTSTADALALLGADAVVIGGGTLVLPLVNEDAFPGARLVDVSGVAGFDRLVTAGDHVLIGPAVTYATLLAAPDAPPLLRRIASGITGGPQIRNQGTIGGSASHANPSSDIPTGLVALEAILTLASARGGERQVSARDFFVDAFTTARRCEELLVGIRVPHARSSERWGYVKIKTAESSWPIAVAAARVTQHSAIITIGAATPVPVMLPEGPRDPVAIRAAVRAANLTLWSDEFGDATYRARLAEVVAVRAVEKALEEEKIMSDRVVIDTTINGTRTELRADPGAPLVQVLRDDAKLRASHVGCANGDCGACTVLIDGEPFKSCLVPAHRIVGKRVETLEGLSPRGELHPVQKAFWDHNAFQCGFCLAGQVLCTVSLLRKKAKPTRADIEEALAGNLCRCTGYQQIVTAALAAAE